MKVALLDLCGGTGEVEAKKDFLKALNERLEKLTEPLDQDGSLQLATTAWKCGFNACNKVIVNAAGRGVIEITTEIEGKTYRFIANR